MKIRDYWWISISIIIIMISCIFFIIYTAFFHTKISTELISDHYYEEEIEYQEIIDEKKNAMYFTPFNIQVLPCGIKISLINDTNISVILNLLRLSNNHFDVARVIQLDSTGKKIIPAYILKYGSYYLKIRWKDSGKRYYLEQKMKWHI